MIENTSGQGQFGIRMDILIEGKSKWITGNLDTKQMYKGVIKREQRFLNCSVDQERDNNYAASIHNRTNRQIQSMINASEGYWMRSKDEDISCENHGKRTWIRDM